MENIQKSMRLQQRKQSMILDFIAANKLLLFVKKNYQHMDFTVGGYSSFLPYKILTQLETQHIEDFLTGIKHNHKLTS